MGKRGGVSSPVGFHAPALGKHFSIRGQGISQTSQHFHDSFAKPAESWPRHTNCSLVEKSQALRTPAISISQGGSLIIISLIAASLVLLARMPCRIACFR